MNSNERTPEMTPPEVTDEMLRVAASMDWQQVVLNGVTPCFALHDGKFCGRADIWFGHPKDHPFVSLAEMMKRYAAPKPPDCEAGVDIMELIYTKHPNAYVCKVCKAVCLGPTSHLGWCPAPTIIDAFATLTAKLAAADAKLFGANERSDAWLAIYDLCNKFEMPHDVAHHTPGEEGTSSLGDVLHFIRALQAERDARAAAEAVAENREQVIKQRDQSHEANMAEQHRLAERCTKLWEQRAAREQEVATYALELIEQSEHAASYACADGAQQVTIEAVQAVAEISCRLAGAAGFSSVFDEHGRRYYKLTPKEDIDKVKLAALAPAASTEPATATQAAIDTHILQTKIDEASAEKGAE